MYDLTPKDIEKIFETVPGLNKPYRYRRLSGGLSGAFVALFEHPKVPKPLVLKSGPKLEIEQEAEGRIKFAPRSTANANRSKLNTKLRQLKLDVVLSEVEIETTKAILRSLVYPYFGPLTFAEVAHYKDFFDIFGQYCSKKWNWAAPDLIETWLDALMVQIQRPKTGAPSAVEQLRDFLPALPWERGLTSVLKTAAAFASEGHELADFHEWWLKESGKFALAQWPLRSILHGDLRFSNVLVRIVSSDVRVIDFGSVTEGHLLRDLAKFECDLLYRIDPLDSSDPGRVGWSTEDLRTETLKTAFGEDFKCLPRDIKASNTQLDALRILRKVYDRCWHFSAEPERHEMYRWFLLAEVLKRLLWFEEKFAGPDGRFALLRSAIMLRRAIDGRAIHAIGLASASQLVRRLGCTATYIPTDSDVRTVNESRNQDKIEALKAAAKGKKTVRLIAETGHSYLCVWRPFYSYVKDLIKAGGHLQIILVNPSFVEAHGISAAHRDPRQLDKNEMDGIHVGRYQNSKQGIEELRKIGPGTVQVKQARYGLFATVLMAGDVIFFEPYFRNPRTDRYDKLLDTFELRLEGTPVRDLFDTTFQFHWDHADDFDDTTMKNEYERLLSSLRALWK